MEDARQVLQVWRAERGGHAEVPGGGRL